MGSYSENKLLSSAAIGSSLIGNLVSTVTIGVNNTLSNLRNIYCCETYIYQKHVPSYSYTYG
jgi:hypothetical protein